MLIKFFFMYGISGPKHSNEFLMISRHNISLNQLFHLMTHLLDKSSIVPLDHCLTALLATIHFIF